MDIEKARHEKLINVINDWVDDRNLRWSKVALRGRISEAHLRRVRKMLSPVTVDVATAIDRGLGWPSGHAWRIAKGDASGPPEIESDSGDSLRIELQDEVEREMWAITELPEEKRLLYIISRRLRLAEEGAREMLPTEDTKKVSGQ